MNNQIKYTVVFFLLLLVTSCVPDVTSDNEELVTEGLSINIPKGFNYQTHKEVTIDITDFTSNVKYDIFIYSTQNLSSGNNTYQDESGNVTAEELYREDIINKPVYSAVIKSGRLTTKITLPEYCEEVYIRRRESLKYSGKLVPIVSGRAQFTHTNNTGKINQKTTSNVTDMLYCVNGAGDLFQVDPLSGDLTMISEMPMGSWTAAIDQENKVLYSIGRSNPYPLMKYDIEADTWSTVANLGMGGPRLSFNTNDNLLYFSDNQGKLFTINPQTGSILNSWQILGLHNTTGGDIDFAEDGTIYVCTFSGLYSIELNQNN